MWGLEKKSLLAFAVLMRTSRSLTHEDSTTELKVQTTAVFFCGGNRAINLERGFLTLESSSWAEFDHRPTTTITVGEPTGFHQEDRHSRG